MPTTVKNQKCASLKSRRSRRVGQSLHNHPNDSYLKKPYVNGQHGKKVSRARSTYALQLIAKQTLKYYYNISEKQLKNYYIKASTRKGKTDVALLGMLESRLDMIVYRIGLAKTIKQARQLVSHGHLQVNGKVVNIPSYCISSKDEVTLSPAGKKHVVVAEHFAVHDHKLPEYIAASGVFESNKDDRKDMTFTFPKLPEVAQIPYQCEIKSNLVVEYYSR